MNDPKSISVHARRDSGARGSSPVMDGRAHGESAALRQTDRVACGPADLVNAIPGGRSVLAIEPESQNLNDLSPILAANGWEVRVAADLPQAAEMLTRQASPVVLVPAELFDRIDEALPNLSPRTKLVATVRFSEYWRAVALLESRAYDILAKPFAAQEVLQVINFAWMSLLREAESDGW